MVPLAWNKRIQGALKIGMLLLISNMINAISDRILFLRKDRIVLHCLNCSQLNISIWQNIHFYPFLPFHFTGIAAYLVEVLGVDMPLSKQWYCCLKMYTFFVAFLCSSYLLIIMTFECFYSIIQPHKAASLNTVKRARIIIIGIFTFYLTYSIPFLFIGGHNGISCVINRYASVNVLGEMYHWLTEVVNFIFPFLSLLTMNSVIIHTLRKRSKSNILGSTRQSETTNQQLANKNPEKQIVTMLLLVTSVFLLLNLPVQSIAFYLNFSSGNIPNYYGGFNLGYQIGEKSYYTNHGINFFLYVISGQKFRTDLRNLFMPKKQNKNIRFVSDISKTMEITYSTD